VLCYKSEDHWFDYVMYRMRRQREFLFFFKRFISQTIYTVCTRIKYKIVPVTNLNKYLHYDTIICI